MNWKWWTREADVTPDGGLALREAHADLERAKKQHKEATKISKKLKIRREANHFGDDIWEAYQQDPRWGNDE